MKLNVIWASIGGAITMMLLGFVIYVLIFPNLFTDMGISNDIMKEEPDMIMIFIGNLAGALLLAFSYQRWASISTFKTGAEAGAIFGFLIALYSGFIQYGTTEIGSSLTHERRSSGRSARGRRNSD